MPQTASMIKAVLLLSLMVVCAIAKNLPNMEEETQEIHFDQRGSGYGYPYGYDSAWVTCVHGCFTEYENWTDIQPCVQAC